MLPQTKILKYPNDKYTTIYSDNLLTSGYQLVSMPDNANGSIIDKDVIVTYYYKKVPANLLKKDSTTKNYVLNAELTVYDSTNKVVSKWKTQEENELKDNLSCDLATVGNNNGCEVITAIEPNMTYIVKETKTPPGYATSPDYIFKVDANGNLKDTNGKK